MPDLEELNDLMADGYPICHICDSPIMPSQKRIFIIEEDTVFILCEDCLRLGIERKHLPQELLKELV